MWSGASVSVAAAYLFLVRRMRALFLTAVFLTACETTWREGASVTAASGERLCAKHRIALVPIRLYQARSGPNDPVVLVHDADHPYYGIAEQYCPNHLPEHVSFSRGDIFQERTTIYYCPLCEKEFRERLRVPDQKAALEFAQYVLPIWGGGGVATKPPYQVSLRGDIWTVSCFLVDGRKATIKISKERGAVLSTWYGKHSSNQTMKLTATAMRFEDAFLIATFLSPQIGLSPSGRSLSFSR
jgi:hypothetical protein